MRGCCGVGRAGASFAVVPKVTEESRAEKKKAEKAERRGEEL